PGESRYQPPVQFLERRQGRMLVGEIEGAAWLQRRGNCAAPAPDIGQPADRSPGRVDEVIVGAAQGRGIVNLAQHEARREPGFLCELPRMTKRGWRKIEAGDARTAAGEAKRVDPDVALQVQELAAADVADLASFDWREHVLAGEKPLDGVEPREVLDMNVGAF